MLAFAFLLHATHQEDAPDLFMLSKADFIAAIQCISAAADTIWEFHCPVNETPYIVHERFVSLAACTDQAQHEDLAEVSVMEEITHDTILRCSYHVLWSAAFAVPSMLFSFAQRDGRTLNHEEALALVHKGMRTADSAIGPLTEQMHPILDMPFLHLQECNTATLMQTLQVEYHTPTPVEYMQTWINIVLPMVIPSIDGIAEEFSRRWR
eukprot:TRINITY_DN12733_c0_g1_i1.p1 TRINITY_DN12733_c0_g1~~TRINITY_DN12733_c0_g1_i1.p1  ORF type:complete len:209 (-),score=31.02 TRINITY_DN12733_c0_g1_i1:31-657(-)